VHSDKALRQHVVNLLTLGEAHATFDQAVDGLPAAMRGKTPQGAEHSPWQILEHLRIAQSDILEFTRDARHQSPKWPDEYWPSNPAPAHKDDWEKSVKAFHKDLKAMCDLVADEKTDLFTPLAHGDGQTALREALLTADHNAYHVGELVLVRRLLGAWK
jgi:hypothetical protein